MGSIQPTNDGQPVVGVCKVHVMPDPEPDPPPVAAAVPVALKVTGLPVTPAAVAVTVLVPAFAPNVRVLEARPELLVVTEGVESVPPPAVTANVIVIPDTPVPLASVTFTVKGLANCWLTVPFWPEPLTDTKVFVVPVPVVPVEVNVIGLPKRPGELAVIVLLPADAPSVNVVDANPRLSLATEVALNAPPPAVTANVTVVPETGLPFVSATLTTKGLDS